MGLRVYSHESKLAVGLAVTPQDQGPAEESTVEAEGGWQSPGFESDRRGEAGGCHFRWPKSELLRWSVGATSETHPRLCDQERQGCPEASSCTLTAPLVNFPHPSQADQINI